MGACDNGNGVRMGEWEWEHVRMGMEWGMGVRVGMGACENVGMWEWESGNGTNEKGATHVAKGTEELESREMRCDVYL